MQELSLFISHNLWLCLATLVIFMMLMIVEFIRAKQNAFSIDPAQATQLLNKKNAVIIDLRTLDAFRTGHIIDSHIIPSQEIQKNPKRLEKFKNKPIIFVSHMPTESQKIALSLMKQGYNAYSLLGGIKAWRDAQLPLVKD